MKLYFNLIILLLFIGCRQKEPAIIENSILVQNVIQNDCIFETFTNTFKNNDKDLTTNYFDASNKPIQQKLQREISGILYDSTTYFYKYDLNNYLTQIKFIEPYYAINDTAQIKFEYNSKKLLSKKILKNNRYEIITSFEYDNNSKLSKISVIKDSILLKEYYYELGKITKTVEKLYNQDLVTIYYQTNNLGRITKKTYPDGSYWIYSYDTNNNLSVTDIFKPTNQKTYTVRFEYDDKNVPLQANFKFIGHPTYLKISDLFPSGFVPYPYPSGSYDINDVYLEPYQFSPNNIISMKNEYINTIYSYQYNSKNYPINVIIKETYVGVPTSTYNYQYSYNCK